MEYSSSMEIPSILAPPPSFCTSSTINSQILPLRRIPYRLRFSLPPRSLAAATATMALKAIHVSNIPNLDQVPKNPSVYSARFSKGAETKRSASFRIPKFLTVGHRGHGMNILNNSDSRMTSFKENSITSFNAASRFPIDYIEFDVQVTKDDCPVIFHDDFILSEDNGTVFEKRVTDLCLSEFMSYGLQRIPDKKGKSLLRKTKDGKIVNWDVETDDSLCTLQEAFQQIAPTLGFNIELKFDDHIVYETNYLTRVLQAILLVVFEFAGPRPIIFSSFQPDAALLVKKLQDTYPVFFLTNGGNQIYYDVRRNSLEEAMKVCIEGGLEGIVSEVKGVFRNPGAVNMIKESKLSLLTYGKLNNVVEAVYMQKLMGIDGVIVDLVKEITESLMKSSPGSDQAAGEDGEGKPQPQFSQRELAFLLKLIPELIQQ